MAEPNDVNSLIDYYNKLYPKKKTFKSVNEEIDLLVEVYNEKMGYINEEVKEGIAEVYRELSAKGNPAFYWIIEAIFRTYKKRNEKRTFSYIVGTIRNWTLYGFGNTSTGEEGELIDYFKETTGIELSVESRNLLINLLSKYGIIKVMKNIPSLKEKDVSIVIMKLFEQYLKEQYEPNCSPVNPVKEIGENRRVIKEIHSSSRQTGIRKKSSPAQKKKIKQLVTQLFIDSYPNPVRPKDVYQHLIDNGIKEVNSKGMTALIQSISTSYFTIEKIGIGEYIYKKEKTLTN